MSLYKVRQSWLYTTAKRNRIPICRIAGKNYYNKKHVDEFFGMAVDMESITDWLLTEKAEEQFAMQHPPLYVLYPVPSVKPRFTTDLPLNSFCHTSSAILRFS